MHCPSYDAALYTGPGGSFYLSHRKELLDVAGEWYLDRVKSELLLAVPVGEKPPAALVAPVVKQLFVMEGAQHNPVAGVRISGVTLKQVFFGLSHVRFPRQFPAGSRINLHLCSTVSHCAACIICTPCSSIRVGPRMHERTRARTRTHTRAHTHICTSLGFGYTYYHSLPNVVIAPF
jgi:hypothetical protein